MAQELFDTIWGSTGDVIVPTTTKQNLGWEDEIPRHEWENWWHNRQDSHSQYLQQIGIAEWLATVTYADNAIVMLAGVLYQSQQAGNVANSPGAGVTWWKPYGPLQLPPGFLVGMIATNNVAAPDTIIDISSGRGRSFELDGISVTMDATAAFTKHADTTTLTTGESWVEGSGNGLLASNLSLTADTWYRLFALSKVTGEVDYALDIDEDATNALLDTTAAGYIYPREIMRVYVDADLDILPWSFSESRPNYVRLHTQTRDFQDATYPSGSATVTTVAPPDVDVEFSLMLTCYVSSSTGTGRTIRVLVSPLHFPDVVPTDSNNHFRWISNVVDFASIAPILTVPVDANSQFRLHIDYVGTVNIDVRVTTLGFYYNRTAQRI